MTQKRRTFTVRAHSAPSKQNMGHQQNMQNKIWDTQKPKGQSPQQNMQQNMGHPEAERPITSDCWEIGGPTAVAIDFGVDWLLGKPRRSPRTCPIARVGAAMDFRRSEIALLGVVGRLKGLRQAGYLPLDRGGGGLASGLPLGLASADDSGSSRSFSDLHSLPEPRKTSAKALRIRSLISQITKYGTPRSRKANHLRLLGNWRTNGRRD